MKPQEKAAKGIELIKQSIVDYLEQHRNGVRNSEIGRELGLHRDPNKFTRTFSRQLLEELIHEGRISPPKRRYFFFSV